MISPRSVPRRACWLVLGIALLLVARDAAAQDHFGTNRPDYSLHADGFDKSFSTAATGEKKSFVTRLFGGSRSATPLVKGGSFQAKPFISGKEGFQTKSFATKGSPLMGRTDSRLNRTFGTKSVAIHENVNAHKAFAVGSYGPGDTQFVPEGKRQEDFDELRRQKNLTIDEVRNLLNRNKITN